MKKEQMVISSTTTKDLNSRIDKLAEDGWQAVPSSLSTCTSSNGPPCLYSILLERGEEEKFDVNKYWELMNKIFTTSYNKK